MGIFFGGVRGGGEKRQGQEKIRRIRPLTRIEQNVLITSDWLSGWPYSLLLMDTAVRVGLEVLLRLRVVINIFFFFGD